MRERRKIDATAAATPQHASYHGLDSGISIICALGYAVVGLRDRAEERQRSNHMLMCDSGQVGTQCDGVVIRSAVLEYT